VAGLAATSSRQRVLAGLFAVAVVAVVAWVAIASLPQGPELPQLAASPEMAGHVLIVLAAILALGGIAAYREGYLAGIWLVSTLGPWAAASVSVITYLLTDAESKGIGIQGAAVYNGVAAGLAAVAALAFLGRELSEPRRAQARTYDSLRDRYAQLRERYKRLDDAPPLADADREAQNRTMLAEACSRLEEVEKELCDEAQKKPALRWALATGYSNLQRTLHRVDEMIVASQPDYAITGDALHDALSLSDSTMAEHDTLMTHLRTAMQTISARSSKSFFAPPGASVAPPDAELPTAAEAREVLREIRFAVNDFRDNRVDGLIRARNRLLWVVLVVGITAYFALGLAMLCGVSNLSLASVSFLYLVAALAGLINRLRIESLRSTAVEDYGLHLARLIAAPLISGLAGVAGVYLVAKTPELLTVVSPTADGAAPEPMDISEIFNVAQNQASLLVAAVFGLVPAQLISGLQRQAERFQADLEKSSPAGGSTLSSGTD
jgi:hypothetical protein